MKESQAVTLEKADDAYVRVDRMRYEKNKISSTFAILAIVFNALFFVDVYKSDVGTWYYGIMIGASVVYNLLFMMIAFLISEGSKNYKMPYSVIAMILGGMQFVRLLFYPRMAHGAETQSTGEIVQVMTDSQFLRVVIFLVISGVCLILSGIIGLVKCTALKKHLEAIQETR